MAKKAAHPEIVPLTPAELETLLAELSALLPEATYQLVKSALLTLEWLLGVLEHKTTSLRRMRRMIFGAKTEKTDKVLKGGGGRKGSTKGSTSQSEGKKKGHGRHSAKDYPGARRSKVPHPTLWIGKLCPQCLKGKLYLFKTPARIIHIVAEPLFQATLYELEQLRCALCGALFTAPAPPQAAQGKYDPSVGVMLAIQRYGVGVPMYRTEKWQNWFGVPLPAGTQWQLIDQATRLPELTYEALLDAAAQGKLFHNDDTPMRVQSLLKEITQAEDQNPKERTGIFTSSIVSQIGEHRAALFFTGRNHAGENLDQLLKRRAAGLDKPLQMCDGLSRNEPKAFENILCNCLPHGRRNFVEVADHFPEECQKVLQSLREVFRVDAQAKERQLSDLDRLALHQRESGPVMEELHSWMTRQLEQKQVEPNSGLGKAINYMLKHWQALTRFLKVAGAPIDNNICERALKMAILHRKNSLSYKTVRGARVGDVFMSLIHTCVLNGINPFDYLMALTKHEDQVRQDPSRWLPWNYQATLEPLEPTNTS
jgi:hypothetical protein